MKRLIFILFFIICLFQLSAQDNVFSYSVTENVITQNKENTKTININRVLQDKANIFSIPRDLIGEKIKPGSVKLSDTSKGIDFDIRDDKDGNLYDFNYSGSYAAFKSSSFDRSQGLNAQGSGSQIGNVFYESGIMVITDTGSYADVGMGSSYSLELKATQKHWEHEY